MQLRPRNVKEIAALFLRRKLLLVFIIAVIGKSSFMAIDRLGDTFESRAAVVIAASDNSPTTAGRIASVAQQLTSRSALEMLIKRHSLYGELNNMDKAVEAMTKQLRVETKLRTYYPQTPELITITFTHTSPWVASQVVGDLVAICEKENDAIYNQTVEEANTIKTKIAAIEQQLLEADQKRKAEIARQSVAGLSLTEAQAERARREADASTLETLSDRQFALERQIVQQKALIAEQEKLAAATPGSKPAASNSAAAGPLLVRKAELESLLKTFATQYTEKNPKVVQVRAQLTEVERQIEKLNAENAGGPEVNAIAEAKARELRDLKRELARLETEQEVTRRALERKQAGISKSSGGKIVAAAPAATTDEGPLEYEVLKVRYQALLSKQTDLQKAQASTNFGQTLFQVVDRPNVPVQPATPNRIKLRLVALAAALLCGLFVVGLLEARTLFVLRDEADIAYYLGVPVVAYLPERLSTPDRKRRRMLMLARGATVFIVGVALIPLADKLFTVTEIFALLAGKLR